MAGLHPQEKLIEELVAAFRITYGGMATEFKMAEELIGLNMVISQYEERLEKLEKDRHRAFYRELPLGVGHE
jgi:hypothetical protein